MPQTEVSPSRRGVDANATIPSYVLSFNVAPVAAMDVITITTPGFNIARVVRLRRVVLVNPGNATAAATVDLQLGTVTGVGSGGSTSGLAAADGATRAGGVTGGPDSLANIVVRSGDTTQGAGFAAVWSPLASVTVPAAAAGFTPLVIYDARDPRFKALTATTTAINLRIPAVGAGATGFRGYAEFTVDDV